MILLFCVQDFFYKKNPKIDFYNMNYFELKDDEDKSKYDLNFQIVIAYSKDLLTTTKIYYEINSIVIDNFKRKYCNETDFNSFNINRNDSLIYMCILGKDILPEFYRLGQSQKFQLKIKTCSNFNKTIGYQNLGQNNCTQDPDPNKNYRVEYYFNSTKFNEKKSSEFFVTDSQKRAREGKIIRLMSGDYVIRQNALYNDDGIFTTHLTEYIFPIITDAHFDGSSGDWFFLFTLEIERGIMKITRSYQKLPEMMAQVFSIIAILNVGFRIASSILSDYLYFHYILSIYKLKIGSQIQNQKEYQKQTETLDDQMKNSFNFPAFFCATFLNFMCKKNLKVQQCFLLKEELIRFISIEEYLKPAEKKLISQKKIEEWESKNYIQISNNIMKNEGYLNKHPGDIRKENNVEDNNDNKILFIKGIQENNGEVKQP